MQKNKGTILNYFGLSNTYNPFTDENALQVVEDINFQIPNLEPFYNANYVAVSTGLLTTSLAFLNDITLAVYDNDDKIMYLENVIGEIGNDKYMPKENQVFWFNKDGLRGTYFLNSKYAGKILKIIRGRFITTSITSGVLNDIFERTIGIPSYITEINNMIEKIKNNSTFIISETITKSGSNYQSFEINWRDDLEYLQISGYVSGNINSLIGASSFGVYQNINDKVPFIGFYGSSSSYYYYGGDFERNSISNISASLPSLKWFPILDNKPIIAMKNNSQNTITAKLYFLVRYIK